MLFCMQIMAPTINVEMEYSVLPFSNQLTLYDVIVYI